MKAISTWPDKAELNLPEAVSQAVINHLQQPFQTEAEAQAFWQENSVYLFLSEPPADAIPEYTDPLPDGYIIQLVIANDSGGGNYYVSKGELK